MFSRELKSLECVKNYLKKIEYINSGGCGIAALAMYKWLMKNTSVRNIKFLFMYCGDEEYSYKTNAVAIKDGIIQPVAPEHCCLLIDNNLVDVNNRINKKYTKRQLIPLHKVIESIRNEHTWNPLFDRMNIKKIENKLGISLAEVVSC
jgi:hypothetical protein